MLLLPKIRGQYFVCVCKEPGYGLDDRGSIAGRGREFSFRHRVQTYCEAHPAYYAMGIKDHFPEGKEAEASNCSLSFI
jgi:hypothetical protein